METVLKIRRMHLVDGKSISAIARETGLSRNTVKKHLRKKITEPPKYHRKQAAKPALGCFESLLAQWLEQDSQQNRRNRRPATRLYADLQRQGYKGAYDSVQRYVKQWKNTPSKKSSYIPLEFQPGEAYQFDWSEEEIELNGVVQRVKAAHFRLANSRMPFVIVFPRETQEMVFAAHDAAFAYWQGLTLRGIYDNLKTCVDTILLGKDRRFNPRFLALMNHFLIEPVACTPAAGWEKGQVEKQVQDIRSLCFSPRRKVISLEELNRQLIIELEQEAKKHPHPDDPEKTIWQAYEAERKSLRELSSPFNGYIEHERRSSCTSLVRYDRNSYSVDCHYANRHVTVRAYADWIQIFADDVVIGKHSRVFGRGKTQYDPWHYIALLERKPGALRNGSPFRQWTLPPSVEQVQSILLARKGGDREMVSLLLAAKDDGLEQLDTACKAVLKGPSVTAALILNQLQHLRQPQGGGRDIPTNVVPLNTEPAANCQRYDQLRQGGE